MAAGSPLEVPAIATPPPSGRPFFTRRSTLVFAGSGYLAAAAYGSLVGPNGDVSADFSGFLALLDASAGLVLSMTAWLGGIILALRSRSVLWMVVSMLPPPIGAFFTAMWAPQPGGPPGRSR